MANYDSNYAIAQEISARIGVSPIPFDSVYSIALEIYNELGGEPTQFDSVYSILLGILPLVEGGIASKVIDDNVITTVKTWSSSKINSELSGKASTAYVDEQIEAVIGAGNSEIEGKETEDFTFVQSLPVSGEEGQQVIIKGDNSDTLYKYVSSEWVEQTPDATKLYFDVENEALYSYVTAEHQFAPVSLVNTIVVGSNLNSNADLKALKTVGVYNVVQRLHNATKGDYVKNWTLYVESIDYEEYDRSDSVYQRLVSNYTIQKRTWSATRASNDGWSNFSTYYAGEIKDTTTSKYYTWSSNKLSNMFANIPQLEAGQNVEIADNKINAKGYFYDDEPRGGLKLIDDILHDAGLPAGQSLGLKISGAAGVTTYTWTDDMGGAFVGIIQYGVLPGVGATYKTANGKSGVIAAVDATTITFEETLDAENALTNEPVDYVLNTTQLFSFAEGIYDYVEMDNISELELTLSGTVGATTYTYSGLVEFALVGNIFRLQDGRSAKVISFDTTNHTITFEETFDADNALVDEPVVSVATKNIASGKYSHAEGGGMFQGLLMSNTASGQASHAEGIYTTASGEGSHAEGVGTNASGDWGSHTEGQHTVASGAASHAEGYNTYASDEGSHSEGRITTASGKYSHAEGYDSEASGIGSHAEGYGTETQNRNEHAEGSYNVSHKNSDIYPSRQNPNGDAGNTLHSIGNGYWQSVAGQPNKIQKNALEIMQNGDMYVKGIGSYQGTDTKVQDNTIKTVQEVINSKADAYEVATNAEIDALFS